MSIVNAYINPATIDNCSFTQNVCMNNCSIINLEISGNLSFQSFRTLNSTVQNLSQSFFSVSTLNTSVQLYNLSQSYWITNVSLQNFISPVSISSLNCCIRSASIASLSVSTISCSSISLINASISFIKQYWNHRKRVY